MLSRPSLKARVFSYNADAKRRCKTPMQNRLRVYLFGFKIYMHLYTPPHVFRTVDDSVAGAFIVGKYLTTSLHSVSME